MREKDKSLVLGVHKLRVITYASVLHTTEPTNYAVLLLRDIGL